MTPIPVRTDLGKIIRYSDEKNRRWLYGEQGGYCHGCEHHFPPCYLTIYHIITRAKGGTGHISNLQLFMRRVQLTQERSAARILTGLSDRQRLDQTQESGIGRKTMTKDKPEVRVQPATYQPRKAELEADMAIDTTPEELARVALQHMTVKTIGEDD